MNKVIHHNLRKNNINAILNSNKTISTSKTNTGNSIFILVLFVLFGGIFIIPSIDLIAFGFILGFVAAIMMRITISITNWIMKRIGNVSCTIFFNF